MSAQEAFCRLVLGEPGTIVDEAAPAAPSSADASTAEAAAATAPRVDAIAAAWLACGPELERRRGSLAWEDAEPGPERPAALAGLVALPDLERGAVAAQALALAPGEIEQALATAPGAAPGLLARAHAQLAGLGLPADVGCAEERERLASAPETRSAPRTAHCADCRAFAIAVHEQRSALRRAADPSAATERRSARAIGPRIAIARERLGPVGPRIAAMRERVGPVRSGGSRVAVVRDKLAAVGPGARRVTRLLEPESRRPRLAVGLAAVLLGGVAGFGAVSAIETSRGPDDDPGVITATPVDPLPPGVGPTQP